MTHNTITVYALLKTLVNDLIKTRYPFLKSISYFSDGSPAQYKNYKNFPNLIHKKDFGMNAMGVSLCFSPEGGVDSHFPPNDPFFTKNIHSWISHANLAI